MGSDTFLRTRIAALEKELAQLKKRLEHAPSDVPDRLYGLWAGATISDEDIEDAKHIWERGAEKFERLIE